MPPTARTARRGGCARRRRPSRPHLGSAGRASVPSTRARETGSRSVFPGRGRSAPRSQGQRPSTRYRTWAAAGCGGNSGTEAKPSTRAARAAPPVRWSQCLSPLRALVFDAYGTLFDVHSVVALCEQSWPGKGAALSQLWRAKQLEYTWQRSLMRRYEDFSRVTEAALRYACAALGLQLDEERRRRLTDAYLALAT